MASMAAYYFAQIFLAYSNNGWFGELGSDYLAFWSSGHIANTQGYIFIYDLNVQEIIQRLYLPTEVIGVSPIAYFPIFMAPFQVMTLMPPSISFLIWTVISLMVFFFYTKERLLAHLPIRYLWLCMLAVPFFFNAFFGQVEVWLMIFTSEFLIAWEQGKSFKSGLWLGLMLLKPQILILIIPYLILNRYWRILGGFIAASSFILLSSFLLIGTDGLIQLTNLWLGFATGLPSNSPEVMMNWRMLGLHVSNLISPEAGPIVILLGSIITLGFCLPFFLNRAKRDDSLPLISLFGIFAATLAITWHSHQHMALVLIPFFFKLLQQDIIPARLFKAWVFIPVIVYWAAYLIVALMALTFCR